MNKTKIEYLTHTWNPIKMKCTRVSAGCANCWHLKYRTRFSYDGKPVLREKDCLSPIRLKKPSIIGVQFMGDLFHESIPFEFIDLIFAIMIKADHHRFIVLTKRPKRMMEYILRKLWDENINDDGLYSAVDEINGNSDFNPLLPHVWFGVSVEDQKTADERIPILLKIPGNHFVSIEPMLGPVDLENLNGPANCRYQVLRPITRGGYSNRPALDWVICGAETGQSARQMNIEWAHKLKNQCTKEGIPFFMKKISGSELLPDELNIREYPKCLLKKS